MDPMETMSESFEDIKVTKCVLITGSNSFYISRKGYYKLEGLENIEFRSLRHIKTFLKAKKGTLITELLAKPIQPINYISIQGKI